MKPKQKTKTHTKQVLSCKFFMATVNPFVGVNNVDLAVISFFFFNKMKIVKVNSNSDRI